jgi:broad specificity phosphatase PhoE
MKLIIVRHGETEENVSGTLMGQSHGNLSSKGKRQIKRLASKLKKSKIDFIYSSDLGRVVTTTKSIARFHNNAKIQYTKMLRERNVGIFQGKSITEYREQLLKSNTPPAKYRPERGESHTDLHKRVNRFVSGVMKDSSYKNKTLLISTHGGVVSMFYSIFFNIPVEEAMRLYPKNCSVTVISVGKHGKAKLLTRPITKIPKHNK